ncbi:hypothetical protein ACS0TY_030418 [Phlomoides rotata]
MASNLYHLLSSSPIARSEFSSSASRWLIVTTAQLFQNQKPETKESLGDKDEIYNKIEGERNSDEENGGGESDEVVKGEIGGPCGPEPTRSIQSVVPLVIDDDQSEDEEDS